MKLVLASGNSGKLKELQDLLKPLNIQLISQAELQVPEPEETGLTFVENAILKARHAANLTGSPAVADDSGLVVDALRGAPGIYSARYAGLPRDDQANTAKLLQALQDVPEAKRTARFCCVIAFMRHAADPLPIICQASWEGRIVTEARGEQGFGYDPVFYVPEYNATAAELPKEIKNQISHRGQAIRALLDQLS